MLIPMSERVTCPCCGHRTLPDGPGAYELCPVCEWEDDGISTREPTVWGGNPNGVSLAEGQRRYRLYGSAHLSDSLDRVRPPRSDEPRDPDWQPYVSDEVEVPAQTCLRDLGPLLVHVTKTARDAVTHDGDDALGTGRLLGLIDAVRLLLRQAETFGLDLDDLGLGPDFDPDEELLPRKKRPGFYAG